MAVSRALITGASAGIGSELARQFAAGGSDLVLTARRLDRLEQLATELRGKYGVKIETGRGRSQASAMHGRNCSSDSPIRRMRLTCWSTMPGLVSWARSLTLA